MSTGSFSAPSRKSRKGHAHAPRSLSSAAPMHGWLIASLMHGVHDAAHPFPCMHKHRNLLPTDESYNLHVLTNRMRCRLKTDPDGMAKNTFWVTDRRGNKLSNYHADLLAERVGDFVVYCTPDKKARPRAHQQQSRACAWLAHHGACGANGSALVVLPLGWRSTCGGQMWYAKHITLAHV